MFPSVLLYMRSEASSNWFVRPPPLSGALWSCRPTPGRRMCAAVRLLIWAPGNVQTRRPGNWYPGTRLPPRTTTRSSSLNFSNTVNMQSHIIIQLRALDQLKRIKIFSELQVGRDPPVPGYIKCNFLIKAVKRLAWWTCVGQWWVTQSAYTTLSQQPGGWQLEL